jgi:hypothetical protein
MCPGLTSPGGILADVRSFSLWLGTWRNNCCHLCGRKRACCGCGRNIDEFKGDSRREQRPWNIEPASSERCSLEFHWT